MIPTSQAYKNAVVSGNRLSTARILFGVYDVTAKDEAVYASPDKQPFTSVGSVNGEFRYQDYKVATFEDDYFKLDGSFYLLPDDANPVDDLLGWWSQSISDAARTFVVPPTITITFASFHSSLGLGLFFGSSEICTDFDVTWYNGATVLYSESVVGNTIQDFNLNHQVANYNKIVVAFKKTKNPYRYARLMEVYFGLESIFGDDELTGATIVEETDPSNASLSINTLKFTVINEDQKFNMLNPTGVYSFLQRRQKIIALCGLRLADLSYEYVQMGVFYLSDWKNSTGLTATLEATDSIGLLDKTLYRNSPYWVNEPVTNVINHILNDAYAGQFFLVISLASAAETISGYIPVKSHRQALLDVMVASRNTLRVERDGKISVSKIDYATPVGSVDYNTMLDSPGIEQKQLVTSIQAASYTYNLNAATTELYKSTFDLSGTGLVFDGVNDYIVAATSGLNTANFSVEFWTKSPAQPANTRIVNYGESVANTGGYLIGLTTGGAIETYIMTDTTWKFMAGVKNISDNQWHHAAVTYDGATVKLYVDGLLDNQATHTGIYLRNPPSPTLHIGNPSYGGAFHKGLIGDVRIWNVARTQAQIQDNMNKQLVGNEAGLVSYWKLNDGVGALANDFGPANNDGVINGGAVWSTSGRSIPQEMVITFDKAAANMSVTITNGAVADIPVYSAVSAKFTIVGYGTVTVIVQGKEYLESTQNVTSTQGLLAGEVPQTATLEDNKLLVGDKAALVAAYVLAYLQRRIKQNFNYWDDPSIQSGDVITVETMFGANRSGVVEKQDISIAPSLIGRMEVVG